MSLSPIALAALRVALPSLSPTEQDCHSDVVARVLDTLDSAQLLQSPEAAAEHAKLRARVDKLLAERHTTNEALSEAAEALRENQNRIAELERPAVERHRREVRESYRWLAGHAREDRDFEGEAVVLQQLREREAVWAREDELAKGFAADPLAVAPWVPGPSAEGSADKLTRLFAPTQALRESEPTYVYRAEHPDSGIILGHYGTETAARAHCEATERRSWPSGTTLTFDWIVDDEDRVAELVVTAGQTEESTTGYIVTALELASTYDEEADE